MWRKGLLAAGVLVFGIPPGPALAQSLSVTGVLASTHLRTTRVVIHVSGPASYRHKRLPGPERLYVDIHGSVLRLRTSDPLPVLNGPLKGIRAAPNRPSVVRVVLDLERRADYRVFALADPFRIVVEISEGSPERRPPAPPTGEAERVAEAPRSPPKDSPRVTVKEVSPSAEGEKADPRHLSLAQRFERGLGRVVIDPGHGGRDPGAIGVTGFQEKEVALDVATRLARILRKELRAAVFLTREKDVFVPLEQRTALANAKKADLFISIHANSSPQPGLSGIETFLLREASSQEALETAARENSVSVEKLSDLQIILRDLILRSKADESLLLAQAVHEAMLTSLRTPYPGVRDLGIRQAPFYVLLGAEMPSVLIETAFLSNPREEGRMRLASYREDLALAIARGVKDFVTGAPITAQAR